MCLNPNHPFVNRRRSEITEDELQYLTDEEYDEYLLWGVNNVLKYMIAEGVVETEQCPDTGEMLYRMVSVDSSQI